MVRVRHIAGDGTLLVRDNLVLALFAQAPLADVASGFKQAVECWVQKVPRESVLWALVGASASERKPVGPTTITRCLSRLKSGVAVRGDTSYFILQGPEEDNPAYRLEVLAQHALRRTASGILNSSLIEFRFPTECLDAQGAESIIQLAMEVAASMPYDSGYVSPAVSWSYESDLYLASKVIGPLGLRHPGLDINFNGSTCYDIDKRCRGPYWITFLGKDLVATLGGLPALQASLSAPITVQPVGSGVMIRAGELPDIGDVNRNEDVSLLRAVAAALEPVTFFGDKTIETYLFDDDDEKFGRWDRRLLD